MRRQLVHPSVLTVVAVAVGAVATAEAAPNISPTARFVTVFTEQVDDKSTARSIVEGEVSSGLLARKVALVDAQQSQAIRAQMAEPGGPTGKLPEDIASFDADIIIQGHAQFRQTTGGSLPDNVFRYDVRVDVRVIRVDSASLLASFTVDRSSLGVSKQLAIGNTAKRVAEQLVIDVAALIGEQRESEFELFVVGIPNVGVGKSVRDALTAMPRVESLLVRTESPERSRYLIRSTYDDARALAEAIEVRDVGLSVVAHARAVVKAMYVAPAAIRLAPRGVSFAHRGPKPSRWMGDVVPSLIVGELQRAPLVATDGAPTHRLVGRVDVTAAGLRVRARVVDVAGKHTIASTTKTCARRSADLCARDVGVALRSGMDHLDLPTRHRPKAPKLQVDVTRLTPIFPATLAAQPDTAVATVTLTNRAKTPIVGAIVRARVPALSTRTVAVPIERMAAGSQTTVKVRVHVDPDALTALVVHRTSVLALVVEYPANDLTMRVRQEHPLVVYGAGTVSWTDPLAVGPFVQPRAPGVRRYVDQIRRAMDASDAGRPLRNAIVLHRALGRLGLRYRVDATRPFSDEALDDLRFPDDTLADRRGDCDDLSVLAASIGEAYGLRVVMLLTPRHVLYAVGTGLVPQAAHMLPARDDTLIVHDSELFIPLESTNASATFEEAWAEGVRAWNTWAGHPDQREVIDVREVWRTRGPLDLASSESKPRLPAVEDFGLEVDKVERRVLASFEAQRRATLKRLETQTRPGGQLVRAGLLARAGRTAEAEAILAAIEPTARDRARVLWLRGNLAMARRAPAEALSLFVLGLADASGPTRGLLHINAAVAAHAVGDRKAFDEHVLWALELGRTSEVETLTRVRDGLAPKQGRGRASSSLNAWANFLFWDVDGEVER